MWASVVLLLLAGRGGHLPVVRAPEHKAWLLVASKKQRAAFCNTVVTFFSRDTLHNKFASFIFLRSFCIMLAMASRGKKRLACG